MGSSNARDYRGVVTVPCQRWRVILSSVLPRISASTVFRRHEGGRDCGMKRQQDSSTRPVGLQAIIRGPKEREERRDRHRLTVITAPPPATHRREVRYATPSLGASMPLGLAGEARVYPILSPLLAFRVSRFMSSSLKPSMDGTLGEGPSLEVKRMVFMDRRGR